MSWSLMFRSLYRGTLQLLYPSTCLLCKVATPPDAPSFCTSCIQKLTSDPHFTCPRCACDVGPFSETVNDCSRCRNERFAFADVSRLGFYEGSLRDAVLGIKHLDGELLAEELGMLLAEKHRDRLLRLGIDVVVPVPLHPLRRWSRGYNQAEALAWGISGKLGIPGKCRWLRRVRYTPMQSTQPFQGRSANLRDAFRASNAVSGKTILLVDDVMTSGSTCNESARALKQAGAAKVHVVVVARSHPR